MISNVSNWMFFLGNVFYFGNETSYEPLFKKAIVIWALGFDL